MVGSVFLISFDLLVDGVCGLIPWVPKSKCLVISNHGKDLFSDLVGGSITISGLRLAVQVQSGIQAQIYQHFGGAQAKLWVVSDDVNTPGTLRGK